MITKVILKNWRSHLESEFNFSNGTNALVGHIGSGKTSVLDSICFGLFGTFPMLQSKKIKLDDVIMNKPVQKDRAEVEVHFVVNGKNYSVKRIIDRKKGTSYSEIKENGKIIEAPNSQRVTETVENIIKVNYDLFSKAIYSEQNALDYFLTIPRGQRMRKIDELLMIDKFEKARSGIVTLTNRIAERKAAKESIIEQVKVDELQKNISELNAFLAKSLSEREILREELEKVTIKKVELENELNELKRVKEALDELKIKEQGIVSSAQEAMLIIENLERNLKNLDKGFVEKKLMEVNRFIKTFEELISEKQKEYMKIQEKLSRSKAEAEFLKKEKIEKLKKEIENKLRAKDMVEKLRAIVGKDENKKIEEKKKIIEKFVGQIEAAKSKIVELQEMVTQLASVKGKCPICESKLTKLKKEALIKQRKAVIKKLKKELEEMEKKKKLAQEELEDLEKAVDRLHQLLLEIKDLDELNIELENSQNILTIAEETNQKLSNELAAMESELQNLQEKFKIAHDDKQKLETLLYQFREYEERKSRISELLIEKENVRREIERLSEILRGRKIDVQEKMLMDLIAKEKEIATKITGLDTIVNEKMVRMKELEGILGNIMKEKEEAHRLEKLIQELKIFEKALELTQIQLRKEFIEAVNYTMNKIWLTLYPYQDFVGIKLEVEGGDYLLQLQDRFGRFVNVEGMVSGGERSLACLALRIAFALVMAPALRILVLDEPTANLDSTSVSVLATTLRERIQEFIDQCFIITHDPNLEEAVTGNAYRLERDKSRDGVTKVVAL